MAMETNELIDVHELTPFKKFIMSIGAIPTSYLDSMSYAELLMWFCNYLQNTVIPTVNNNGQAVEELQALYVELKSYVDNYFDNNFPELVSNKLDEMAEDGTLENLLNDLAHLIKVYETHTDMIADSENFTDGLKIKTLGYSTANDFGNAEYIVTSVEPSTYYEDLNNGLYLKLILKDRMNIEVFGLSNLEDLNNINLLNIKELICNKNYTLTSKVILENIILNLNSNTINDNNATLDYMFEMRNNTTLKNGVLTHTAITTSYNNGIYIKGNNIIIDNNNISGFNGIFTGENSTYINITISNNIMNSKRYNIVFHQAIINELKIINNKQTEAQTWETPNSAMSFCEIINGYNRSEINKFTKTILDNNYGKNYYFANNEFNTLNMRAFNIINAHNVIVENNICNNPYGDKTNHTRIGYSDDIIVLDFCSYSSIINNVIINSGENAIDLLSCKYCNIENNILKGIDATGVDLNNSDVYTDGYCDNTITATELESSNNIINNNIIECKTVGVTLRNARNTIVKGNSFSMTSDHTNNKTVHLSTSEPFATSIGNYGITVIDNQHTGEMEVYCSNGTLWKSLNSNIYLGQNDRYKRTVAIDNTSLANNTDLKAYDVVHSLYFKNVKFYYIDSNNKRIDFEPLSITNKSYSAPFGINDVYIGENRVLFNTYKHYLPLQNTTITSSYYDKTSGNLYMELW